MRRRVLVIGYGNPGRLDDGLGPAFAARIDNLGLEGVTVDADYQLTVEDAQAVAGHEVVLFADAALAGPEPFDVTRVFPGREGQVSFSSHSVDPPEVLALAEGLFGSRAEGYALAIRGYEFDEFGERLSDGARRNLDLALQAVAPILAEGRLEALLRPAQGERGTAPGKVSEA